MVPVEPGGFSTVGDICLDTANKGPCIYWGHVQQPIRETENKPISGPYGYVQIEKHLKDSCYYSGTCNDASSHRLDYRAIKPMMFRFFS
jgi:hypothetical protein